MIVLTLTLNHSSCVFISCFPTSFTQDITECVFISCFPTSFIQDITECLFASHPHNNVSYRCIVPTKVFIHFDFSSTLLSLKDVDIVL